MKTLQKALILAGFCQLFTVAVYAGHPTTKLSVEFVGMTNNPTSQRKPILLAVNTGATGLCALFSVTNNSTTQAIWFDTVSIEQRTAAGWKPFVPSGSWTEVVALQWLPRHGCLLAVAWPPGLATNATWRLQMSYGQDTSTSGPLEEGNLNIREFYPCEKISEGIIPSSEVHQ